MDSRLHGNDGRTPENSSLAALRTTDSNKLLDGIYIFVCR
jgi:hypothetical protein